MHHRVHLSRGHGFKELVKHVQFAQQRCDGEFRVVVAGATDLKKVPHIIAWCEPRKDIKLKIKSFDADTGELWADVLPA